MSLESRRFSPAAERNKDPIAAALARLLPPRGDALEIASGSGQHVVHLAAAFPDWTWQPTDGDPESLASIAAWIAAAGVANVRAPLHLDVEAPACPILPMAAVDAVFCANLLHISRWRAGEALFAGAGRLLRPGGLLLIYGPFLVDGEPTAPSNLAFDADLKRRDPEWGLRRLADLDAAAAAAGIALEQRIALPANNQLLVFRLPRGVQV
jgi:SAM-dependent methyltransferase